MGSIVTLLADVRNMCAHDDVILGYAHAKADIGVFPEHGILDLRKNKDGSLIQGRKDLMAVLISLKYLSAKGDFEVFMGKLMTLVGSLEKSLFRVDAKKLLAFIGLSEDYAKLCTI